MRLLTWNVAGRIENQRRQAEYIKSVKPDVICLQEVGIRSVDLWRTAIAKFNMKTCDSFDCAEDLTLLTGRRRYGVLIGACYKVESFGSDRLQAPWPERTMSATLQTDIGTVELHSVHLPAGSSDRAEKTYVKTETFEGIARSLSHKTKNLRILCGDFNSPFEEFKDGRIVCFGGKRLPCGSIVPRNSKRLARQYYAEHSVMTGLRDHGLSDSYRAVHGYEKADYSFETRKDRPDCRRRFDHVFSSSSMNPVNARYDHNVLKEGLSDHAPLIVDYAAP